MSAVGTDDAARRWLGWRVEDAPSTAPGPVALPLWRTSGIVRPHLSRLSFAAVDRRSFQMVAAISILATPEGTFEAGGAVTEGWRGRGYGTEALRAVCDLAHRHFGIVELRAGCEVTNTASVGWLGATGFVPAPGPAVHTLPDGREIAARWWAHRDPGAKLRCPWIGGEQITAVAAAARAARPAA